MQVSAKLCCTLPLSGRPLVSRSRPRTVPCGAVRVGSNPGRVRFEIRADNRFNPDGNSIPRRDVNWKPKKKDDKPYTLPLKKGVELHKPHNTEELLHWLAIATFAVVGAVSLLVPGLVNTSCSGVTSAHLQLLTRFSGSVCILGAGFAFALSGLPHSYKSTRIGYVSMAVHGAITTGLWMMGFLQNLTVLPFTIVGLACNLYVTGFYSWLYYKTAKTESLLHRKTHL